MKRLNTSSTQTNKQTSSMNLEDLQQGAEEHGTSSGIPDPVPDSIDIGKFQRGQKFFKDHLFIHLIALICSLVSGLSIRNLLDALVFTGKSNTSQKAIKRYYFTARHVMKWVYSDVWCAGSMGAESIKEVRGMHSKVRDDMSEACGNDQEVFLSQYDMALTQIGFVGAIVMYPHKFNVKHSIEDLDGFVYFWCCIGRLLGVNDKYNICKGGYRQTYMTCKDIEQRMLLPAMRSPPAKYKPMADAFTRTFTVWGVQLISTESVLAHVFDGIQASGPNFTWKDKLRMIFMKLVLIVVGNVTFLERWINRLIERVLKCDQIH